MYQDPQTRVTIGEGPTGHALRLVDDLVDPKGAACRAVRQLPTVTGRARVKFRLMVCKSETGEARQDQGFMLLSAGRALARYELRLTVYRDLPRIRLEPTFTLTCPESERQLEEPTLTLGGSIPAGVVTVGGEMPVAVMRAPGESFGDIGHINSEIGAHKAFFGQWARTGERKWVEGCARPDGGFSWAGGHRSAVRDTCHAVRALMLLGTPRTAEAERYLWSCQAADGGFGHRSGTTPTVTATWQALSALLGG